MKNPSDEKFQIQTVPTSGTMRQAMEVPATLRGLPIPAWHLGAPCFEVDGHRMILAGFDCSQVVGDRGFGPSAPSPDLRHLTVIWPLHTYMRGNLEVRVRLIYWFIAMSDVREEEHEVWRERREFFVREIICGGPGSGDRDMRPWV